MPTSTLRNTPHPMLRRLPLALASACLLSAALPGLADNRAPTATALPGGLNVVRGQASVQTQGQQMTVTNSAGAILNWQQFSIGPGAAVYFQQPSSVSQVLNRVVGRDPSQILGQLGSNGRVWLLNPHGVLFGRDARIDVAGLVASTLNIRDDDWLAGRYHLTQGDAAGALLNQGVLQADEGGRILLVGGSAGVRNEGLIEAPGGQVLLAAGQSVELVDTHLPHMAVRLEAPAGAALNLGRISAAGGHVDLMAALVNQEGIVRADTLGEGPGGRIVLDAQDRLTLGAGSVTSASSASGTGGGLTLSGRQIALLDGAQVDASGTTGGGQITVGGGQQGRDPGLRHAEAVWMAPTASIVADATQQGDGGSIVLWSDQATRVYGTLSARGGALGGNGGFIETSGGWLDARPAQVRTDAARGRAGLWLLDPWDITISDTGSDSNIGGGPDFSAVGSSATILTSTIEAALEAGNNVSITTSSSGFEAGDIRMLNATVDVTPSSPVSLTLLADRNIVLDGATILSQGAPLSITLSAAQSGAGAILINASTLQTAGGDLLLTGNGTFCNGRFCDGEFGTAALATDSTGLQHGVAIASSLLDAGAGRIDVFGQSEVTLADTSGILVTDGATLRGRDINLRGVVVSSGTLNRTGVKVAGGLVAATNSLSINGQAYSSVYSYDGSPTGVDILGEVRLDGSGGTGEGDSLLGIYGYSEDAAPGYGGYGDLFGVPRVGVGIRGGTGRVVATNGASVDIEGTATGSGSGADLGVRVDSTATGAIDTSQGADLSLYSSGSLLVAADLRVSELGGRLSLQSDSTLFILGATITGDPSSVDIVTTTGLQIGSSTQPARLVFGDNTSVNIEAAGFLFGSDSFVIPDQGEVFAPLAVDGRVRPLAVLADTPGSATLLAAGGPITVFTDSLSIGANATFYSPAFGKAVTLAGTADNLHALSLFDNQAGANAMSTPNGYWEVWAQAPEGEGLFSPGGLVPDFRQVDAVYGQTQPALSGARGFFFQGSAQLTLFLGEGAPPITKVYDGSPSLDADFYGLFVSGFRGQDSLDGALGYDDKNVGSGKSIALNAFGLSGIQGPDGAPVFGYTLEFSAGLGVAAITPATLDLLGAQISDKVYDGTAQAVVQQWDLSGFVPGDDLVVIGDALFADKNVASAKPVSLSVLGLSGIDAGNYVLGNVTTGSTTGNLLPAPLNLVIGSVADKVYDGGTAATVSSASVSGVVGSEVLSFALGGSFDDRNAGVGKAASVTLTGFGGADAGNYTLGSTLSVATSATITPATLNLLSATVASKTYDGGTSATVTAFALAGAMTGDDLQPLGSASFADKNAGSAKPVGVTLSGLGGADAANYQLGVASATTAADILPAPLNLLSATTADKVYDGNTSASATGRVLGGVVTGDDVVGAGGASFSDRNAGTAKTVTVTLTGFTGADAGNYSLGSGTAASTTASITPATVDLLGGSIANKVYDGGTSATVTAWSLTGVVAGDTVNASGSAAFVDKNVGTAKPVALVLGGLAGADAGNYLIGTPTATGSASITPATVNVDGATVSNKTYDRTTTATVTGFALTGVVGGDSVAGSGSASFMDRQAGVAKPVDVRLTALTGADAGNYVVGQADGSAIATIFPAPVTLAGGTAASKTYDGTVNTTATSLALAGVIAGDSVSGSADARFADRNVGSAKPVTLSLLGLSGADAGNYTLGGTLTATTTAAITQALLTYVATPATVAADAPLTGFTGVVTGFVGGDTLASATAGTAVFSPAFEGAPPPGVYPLNGSGLTAANYSLTQALGNATALTVIAASAPPPPPPPPPPVSGEQAATVVTPTERVAGVRTPRDLLPAPLATAPEIGRLLDLMPALDPNNRDAIFGALDLSGLGPDRVAAVLAARDEYKKALFSPALARLEQDPSLADAPGCATAQQAASGQCLMVTPLDRESVISNARVVERLPIGSPPAVQPAPPPPAAAGAPAAPAAPAALAAPRPPVPVVVPPFPERRGIRQATLPQIQRKIAVVVGIDQYADARIPRLANSVRDAQAVAQKLENTLGYETVVLENPTKAALFRVLNRLTAESSAQDSVVLYYAGHGELVPQTGLGYWQPSDADATRPETWVSNSDINRVLRGIGASQVALVSDSCFSGSLVSETRIRGVSPTQDPAGLLARRAAVVMSSGGNEPVADAGRNGHSPFAFSLMQAMDQVPAWRPGSNLFEQVRFQVARQLPQRPQYGASGQGGHEAGADYVFEQRQLEGVTR